jgi:iron-sulfur cluster assembly accessory protein
MNSYLQHAHHETLAFLTSFGNRKLTILLNKAQRIKSNRIKIKTNTKMLTQIKTFAAVAILAAHAAECFTIQPASVTGQQIRWTQSPAQSQTLYADATGTEAEADSTAPQPSATPRPSAGMEIEHIEPEDAIIRIAPKAMIRLRELQAQSNEEIVLRMGVRNGGCSGLSYVMDFSKREDIEEDDAVDEYEEENIVCVVDAKSMLYLYGLELDYSDELIGGGFKFFNPNAEESCGCGSSFGV